MASPRVCLWRIGQRAALHARLVHELGESFPRQAPMAAASASRLPVKCSEQLAFQCAPVWHPRLGPGPAVRASGRQASPPARRLTNAETNTQQLGEPQSKQASGEPSPLSIGQRGQQSSMSAANAPAERAADDASFESGRSSPSSSCCRNNLSHHLGGKSRWTVGCLAGKHAPRLVPPPGDRFCACLHISDTSAAACLRACAPRSILACLADAVAIR